MYFLLIILQPLAIKKDEAQIAEEQKAIETIGELNCHIFDIDRVNLFISYFFAKSKTKPEALLYSITQILNTNDIKELN